MRDNRLKALRHFESRPMPNWGGDMSEIYFDDIYYYIKPTEKQVDAWDELPESVKNTYEKLGIAEEGSKVHYIEGCSAPVYTTDSLHSAVVEIVVRPSARVTYTTIQNWSNNVYNLVTKRARVEAEGHMEWVDGNIGCLAQGSTVTTRSGPKPIELVTPG